MTGAPRWPPGRYFITGFVALFVLVFVLGSWSAFARISGAVIASGSVEVEGNRQIVQHPTGGVIEAILVRDDDAVEAGEALLRLEGHKLRFDLAVVEAQHLEILARKNRLAAERDGLAAIAFDPDLLADRSPETARLTEAQSLQFEAHRRALEEEAAALRERMVQIGRQIEGMEAQRAATTRQAELLRREIVAQETLSAKGLTTQTQLLTRQRELARLEGTEGQIEAGTAESRARIVEIEIEILRLGTEARKTAIAELRDLEFREIELRERRASLREEVARLELRSPVAGIVYGSTVDTVRGVVRPAEPIMFIVPQSAPLVVRARIEPIHIDQVHPGQGAVLRFPAFNARVTPDVEGEVVRVSADIIRDERSGESYYRADIRIAGTKLEGVALVPGMPVEAFMVAGRAVSQGNRI
jgi:HlyD family secretion protein